MKPYAIAYESDTSLAGCVQFTASRFDGDNGEPMVSVSISLTADDAEKLGTSLIKASVEARLALAKKTSSENATTGATLLS